jgi:molybdate transport system substrate-binding protein
MRKPWRGDWWLVTRKRSIRWTKFGILTVLILIRAVLYSAHAQEQRVRVAAAADLKFVMDDLAKQFERKSGTKLDVTYGSSGNFFSQIQNGAPFDVFFSADIRYPHKLVEADFAEPATLYEYAVGRIVIWMPRDAELDLANLGWRALIDTAVERIAIANPEHAPYGRAAVAALTKAGIYEQVKAKLVYGENISQAAQFVQSGNAQAGIIAASLTAAPAMRNGKKWEIPTEMHAPIEQGAVVLKNAKNKRAAAAFLEFVKSEAGRATLARYGFTFPPNTQ